MKMLQNDLSNGHLVTLSFVGNELAANCGCSMSAILKVIFDFDLMQCLIDYNF